MTKAPLEGLLRPPYEFISAGTLCIAGAGLWVCAPILSLTTLGLVCVSLPLTAFAIYRGLQGWQVERYQHRLYRLRHYALKSSHIPTSKHRVFLGKGFLWQPIHIQRLRDVQNARALRHRPSEGAASVVGGEPTLHGVGGKEQNVFMPMSDRVGHTLVLGTTRVGKTRLLEVLVTQDIHRGDVVIVLDPKGDADLFKRLYLEAKRAGREDNVIAFHLAFPQVSARYNPIGSFAKVTEVANRVTGPLASDGDSAAFKAFAWRFTNLIAQALVALGKPPNYHEIAQNLLNIEPLLLEYAHTYIPDKDPLGLRTIEALEEDIDENKLPFSQRGKSKRLLSVLRYVENAPFEDNILTGLCSACDYDKTYFDKITASLLPLLEKLTTGKVAELLSPHNSDIHDNRPWFDWQQVIRNKKIVYVGLDALTDQAVASAVGNAMLADLCSVAGKLYNFGVNSGFPDEKLEQASICLHADEFNELCGDEFIPLLNKAGGAGMQVTAYTQTESDVQARVGNSAKALQMMGNFNSLICLRVKSIATAEIVTRQLNQRVQVMDTVQASSVSDSTLPESSHRFSTSNEDRLQAHEQPLLSPEHLIQLPKGQAFCILQGSHLYKVRLPLPKDLDMDELGEIGPLMGSLLPPSDKGGGA